MKEENKREILKYFEVNENEITIYQNLQNTAKTVLREKSVALNTSLKKKEISQNNDLTFHLKKLEPKKQIKPKVSKRKEIIKIKVETI